MGRIEEIEALTRDWEGSFVHGEMMLLQLTHVNWLIAEVARLRTLAVALEQEIARLGGPGSWKVNCLAAEQQIIVLKQLLDKMRAERDALKAEVADLQASLGHVQALRDQAVEIRDEMAGQGRRRRMKRAFGLGFLAGIVATTLAIWAWLRAGDEGYLPEGW